MSTLKVDTVRPVTTNGSLSLKGDSGGSATTNGISVDSSGDTYITGTATISSLNADNFIGLILPFAYNTSGSPPTGFLECDGSAVSRSTYADLFTSIGTAWGSGDGTTTFNLPDLRGAFLRGSGSHGSSTMANASAFSGPSVGSFDNDMFQGHAHKWSRQSGSDVVNSMSMYGASSGVFTAFSGGGGTLYGDIRPGNPQTGLPNDYGTVRTGNETRPFNAGVIYCIKY